MEGTSEGTKGKEKVYSHQHQKYCGHHGDPSVCQVSYCKCNSGSRSTVCHQIHNGGAGQLHGKNLHGNLTKFFCILIHFFMLSCICLKNLQFF